MARISQYDQDSTLNKLDKVVGTDSATGATKNYSIDSMMSLVNSEGLVNVFDGVSYSFKSYEAGSTNPRGIINLNEGSASDTAFGTINQIYVSVLDTHGNPIANYLDDTLDSLIRIVQKTNIDIYGVLEVISVADHDEGAYKLLTVTPKANNGNIVVNEEYFISNYSASATTDKFFTFSQASASANWVIQHDLKKFPSVTAIDSANNIVYGNATYTDENNLTITFSAPFSGKAYLN